MRMNSVKTILASVLVFAFLLAMCPLTVLKAQSVEIIDSGYCGGEGNGTNLSWTLNSEGTLIISGKGEMANYDFGRDDHYLLTPAPWCDSHDNVERIKRLVIKFGVTSVGKDAFYNCIYLSAVTIEDSVTRIESRAFAGCTSLSSVVLSKSLDSLGEWVFEECTSLITITIPDSVTTIGWGTFYNDINLKSVVIPGSVTSIENYAFSGCTDLKAISIPESVINIGREAFYNTAWYNAQPDGLVYAGKVAYGYKGIMPEKSSIVLQSGTIGIAGSAFHDEAGLTSITIPDSVVSIGDDAFYGCKSLSSVSIGNRVQSIGGSAFYGCEGLTSISIPESVISIIHNAFYGCNKLTSIRIPDSVKEIGHGAFIGCSGLTSIFIGKGVTTIGPSTFVGCSKRLVSVEVDSGNTYYHSEGNCLINTNSKDLILGCKTSKIPADGSVTIISDGAFSDCIDLNSIIIPESVTHITTSAFSRCTGLTHIDIPLGVKRIGNNSFSGCSGLTTVTIPKSITHIEDFAFSGCTYLTDIYYTGSENQWNQIKIFQGNEPIKNAVIHYGEQSSYYLSDSDIFSFNNSSTHFGSSYYISDKDFQKLISHVKEMYGSYSSSVINEIQRLRESRWGGSCYGMAVATILDKLNKIGFNENFDPSASTMSEVSSPSQSENVKSAINYYFLSQVIPYVRETNTKSYSSGDSDWSVGLKQLVSTAQKGNPMLFCYFFFNSYFEGCGHAIVIKGYEMGENGSHRIIAYDNRYPDKDIPILVDKDYSSCVINGNENAFAIEYCENMSAFDRIDIDGENNIYQSTSHTIETPSSNQTPIYSGSQTAVIKVRAKGKVTIVNKEKETLIVEKGTHSGSMDVIKQQFMVANTSEGSNATCLTFTVANSDSFSFESDSEEMFVSVQSDELFASAETNGANYVVISEKDGISALGDSFSYDLSLSVNNTMCDMVSISGNATNDVKLTLRGNKIQATGVDTENGVVTVYSNTVDVDHYSYLSGYGSFVITSSGSGAAGEVSIMGSSGNNGIYDRNIGIGSGTESSIRVGDVDFDGDITAADARLALRRAVNLETYAPGSDAFIAADVDKDNEVTASDARLILRAAVGLEDRKDWLAA